MSPQSTTGDSQRSAHRGFTLVELLVVIAIIGVLVALLLPAVQAAREAARRMSCTNNLKQLGLASLNYETALGHLPRGSTIPGPNISATGKNGVSWLVAILPYAEQGNLSDQISERIKNHLSNNGNQDPDAYFLSDLNEIAIDLYQCPSDDPAEMLDKYQPDMAASSYVGIAGSGYSRASQIDSSPGGDAELQELFDFYGDSGVAGSTQGANNYDGVIYMGSRTELQEVTDGTSNTMLAGERWYSLRAWTIGGYWTTGVGSGFSKKPPTGAYYGQYGFAFKNVDRRYPINASLDDVGYYQLHDKGEFQRPDMPPGAPQNMQTNDLLFGSFHPGGAIFTYVDGSVHFLTDDIELFVYESLASKNGGEVFDSP